MAPSQGPGGPLGGTVGPKASYVSTVHVRGKQRLEVQGPRLNSKKEEMAQKLYGPDRRLDLVIQQEMPLLQVQSNLSLAATQKKAKNKFSRLVIA